MKKIRKKLTVLALLFSLILMVVTIILLIKYNFIIAIITFVIGYILKIVGIGGLEDILLPDNWEKLR